MKFNIFKKSLILVLLLIPCLSFAVGKVIEPIQNQQSQSMGGKRTDNSEAKAILVDPSGYLITKNLTGNTTAYTTGLTNIASAGATDRTQLTALATNGCFIQAPVSNSGAIYVGGSTVTNASGTNEGLALYSGWSLYHDKISNLNEVYIAADVAGDDVKYLCK